MRPFSTSAPRRRLKASAQSVDVAGNDRLLGCTAIAVHSAAIHSAAASSTALDHSTAVDRRAAHDHPAAVDYATAVDQWAVTRATSVLGHTTAQATPYRTHRR